MNAKKQLEAMVGKEKANHYINIVKTMWEHEEAAATKETVAAKN